MKQRPPITRHTSNVMLDLVQLERLVAAKPRLFLYRPRLLYYMAFLFWEILMNEVFCGMYEDGRCNLQRRMHDAFTGYYLIKCAMRGVTAVNTLQPSHYLLFFCAF